MQTKLVWKKAESSATALCYDERCLLHCANYAHPEQPARLSTAFSHLKSQGLVERCRFVQPLPASDDELLLTHSRTHIDMIDSTAKLTYKEPEPDSESSDAETLYPDCQWIDPDTFVNQHSALAARLASGGLLQICQQIAEGTVRNGFSLMRPPGHHCFPEKASGFCLYNSVAVAANVLKRSHGYRVMIVDFDVHHGDGTQKLFEGIDDVLFCSVHRWQNGKFYPHKGGELGSNGVGDGTGFSVNVPFDYIGCGDRTYSKAMEMIILPLMWSFKPDFVLVSAGFDCALGDPLGGQRVSPLGFQWMSSLLVQGAHRLLEAKHQPIVPKSTSNADDSKHQQQETAEDAAIGQLVRSASELTLSSSRIEEDHQSQCAAFVQQVMDQSTWTSEPKGKIAFALEGGYNVRAVASGVEMCVRSLLGDALIDASALSNQSSEVNDVKVQVESQLHTPTKSHAAETSVESPGRQLRWNLRSATKSPGKSPTTSTQSPPPPKEQIGVDLSQPQLTFADRDKYEVWTEWSPDDVFEFVENRRWGVTSLTHHVCAHSQVATSQG